MNPERMTCGPPISPSSIRCDQLVEHRVVVAHVAHGGDAGQQIEQRVVLAEVRVHLVHAGDQRAAGAVDGDLAGRRRTVERLDRGDLLAADDHAHRLGQRAGLGIEQPDVADAHRRRRSGARPRAVSRRSARCSSLRRACAVVPPRPRSPCAHHDRVRRHRANRSPLASSNIVSGVRSDARKVIARDLERAAFALDVQGCRPFPASACRRAARASSCPAA